MPTRQREQTEDDLNIRNKIVLPGQFLGQQQQQQQTDESINNNKKTCGYQIHPSSGVITSTILGINSNNNNNTSSSQLLPTLLPLSAATVAAENNSNANKQDDDQVIADVVSNSTSTTTTTSLTPTPGATVLFRVTKVQTIGVSGPIVAINNTWCSSSAAGAFRGFVRLDDIRSVTAKEVAAGLVPTHAAESYRLGDLVAAQVISLSEARQFQLTTTPAHCGMVKCFSESKVDGKWKHAVTSKRDQVVVEDAEGNEKLISRWVPDFRTI